MTAPSSPIYNGRYELRNQIARGGTAQVYLARDLLLDRPVALKVLIAELSSDRSFVERFRREAQAAANLSHPNIVQVFDWGESESTYFIVMEYVDGEPLSSIIRTQAPLSPIQAATIAVDIAKALSYAHRHGVVHRDVKPGNVLITADGHVKVTDFGIARAIGGSDDQITQTGLVMGTATYFSPEQAQGLEVDGRSDVYSLGVVLYEMATGKPPFVGETPVAIAYQHVREQPLAPRVVNPDIPAALEAIILQAMAKLPAERYATAEDFRADLDRFVRGQTVLAIPPQARLTHSVPQTTMIPETPAAHDEQTTKNTGGRIPSTTGRWLAAGLVLVLAIALVVGVGGRQLGYFGGKKYVTIPDVMFMNVTKARSVLAAHGFRSSVETVSGSTGRAQGTVLTESPGYPTSIRGSTTIHLGVAGAPPKVYVPSVTDITASLAISTLEQLGLKAKKDFVKQSTPSQTQGEVIRQKPKANRSVSAGSTVTIYIVRGNKNVDVPSFLVDGIPESAVSAAAAITKAGLNVGPVTSQFSSTIPTGDVISSAPPSGTPLLQGKSVSLTVSEGPGVTVPYLYGAGLATAEADLTSVGLNYFVGRLIGTSNPLENGTVAYQQYAPGTVVAPDTVVKIRIGVTVGGASTTSTTTPVTSTSTTTTTLVVPPTT